MVHIILLLEDIILVLRLLLDTNLIVLQIRWKFYFYLLIKLLIKSLVISLILRFWIHNFLFILMRHMLLRVWRVCILNLRLKITHSFLSIIIWLYMLIVLMLLLCYVMIILLIRYLLIMLQVKVIFSSLSIPPLLPATITKI